MKISGGGDRGRRGGRGGRGRGGGGDGGGKNSCNIKLYDLRTL